MEMKRHCRFWYLKQITFFVYCIAGSKKLSFSITYTCQLVVERTVDITALKFAVIFILLILISNIILKIILQCISDQH